MKYQKGQAERLRDAVTPRYPSNVEPRLFIISDSYTGMIKACIQLLRCILNNAFYHTLYSCCTEVSHALARCISGVKVSFILLPMQGNSFFLMLSSILLYRSEVGRADYESVWIGFSQSNGCQ